MVDFLTFKDTSSLVGWLGPFFYVLFDGMPAVLNVHLSVIQGFLSPMLGPVYMTMFYSKMQKTQKRKKSVNTKTQYYPYQACRWQFNCGVFW